MLLKVWPLFDSILKGPHNAILGDEIQLHSASYIRRPAYFLVDGISSRWTILACPVHEPANKDVSRYTNA